jgi:hypothetical protein
LTIDHISKRDLNECAVEAIGCGDGGGRERGVSGFVGALWLARKEIKGAWHSYPLSGLFVVFVGLFAGATSMSGFFELEGFGAGGQRMEGYYNAFFLDYLFLAVCAFLGMNTVFFSADPAPLLLSSWDYWRDISTSRRPLLLRGLPISARSLVGCRILSVLLALLVNAVAFFVPVFLLSDLGEIGPTSYLWFAGIWMGYALCTSGLWLLCELTLRSDRAHALISFGFAVMLVVVVLLIEWTLEPGLVEGTARLAQSPHGVLFALCTVVSGAAVLGLLSRLTARSIERRDLSEELSSREVGL